MQLRAGDIVKVRYGGEAADAVVTMASENGRSLILQFDAVLGGYVGTMPVLGESADGPFRDLITQQVVAIALSGR